MSKDDKFLEQVLIFVDRNGVVLSKDSNPMSCSLKMSYQSKTPDLKIEMHAYAAAQGNGSCSAEVMYEGEIVYKASGCFTASPFKTKVEKYIPGEWEDLIQ